MKAAHEFATDINIPGNREVFAFLMLSEADLYAHRMDGQSGNLEMATLNSDGGSITADELASIRARIREVLTDRFLYDAGFELIPLEGSEVYQPDDLPGEALVRSFSKLGPAALVEQTWINTNTGLPIEYRADLMRRAMTNSYVDMRLAKELSS